MSRFNYKYENAEALCRIRKVANELGYDVVSLRDAKEFWEEISDSMLASFLHADTESDVRRWIIQWQNENPL